MDLARWWADRRWVALLELIDQLPQASRFMEAVANDPEQAALIIQAREQQERDGEQDEPWSPRLSEFGLMERLQRDTIQALMGVQAAIIAASGNKPPRQEPYPVPVTEVDRAVQRANKQWAQNIIDIFTPGRGAGTN